MDGGEARADARRERRGGAAAAEDAPGEGEGEVKAGRGGDAAAATPAGTQAEGARAGQPKAKAARKAKGAKAAQAPPAKTPPPALAHDQSLAGVAAAAAIAAAAALVRNARGGAPWLVLEASVNRDNRAAAIRGAVTPLGVRASADCEAVTRAAVLNTTGLNRAGRLNLQGEQQQFTASVDTLAALRSHAGALGAMPSEAERAAAVAQSAPSNDAAARLETPEQRAKRLKQARARRAREMEEQRRVNAEREAEAKAEAEKAAAEAAAAAARMAEEERRRKEELRKREAAAAAAREEARQRDREAKEAERKRLAEQREAQRRAVSAAKDTLLAKLLEDRTASRTTVTLAGSCGESALELVTSANTHDGEKATEPAASEAPCASAGDVAAALRAHVAAHELELPLSPARPETLGAPDAYFRRHVCRTAAALALPAAVAAAVDGQGASFEIKLDVSTYPSEGPSALAITLPPEVADPRTAEAGRAQLFSQPERVPRGGWDEERMERTARSIRGTASGTGDAAAQAVLELVAEAGDRDEDGSSQVLDALAAPLERLSGGGGDSGALAGWKPASYWAACRILLAAAHMYDRAVAQLAAAAAGSGESTRISEGAVELGRAMRRLAEAAHTASGQPSAENTAALAALVLGEDHPAAEACSRVASAEMATAALTSGEDAYSEASDGERSVPERLWAYRSLCRAMVDMGCIPGAGALARAAASQGGSTGGGKGGEGGGEVSFLAILRKPGNSAASSEAVDPRVQELRASAASFLTDPAESEDFAAFLATFAAGGAPTSEEADKARSADGSVKELEPAAHERRLHRAVHAAGKVDGHRTCRAAAAAEPPLPAVRPARLPDAVVWQHGAARRAGAVRGRLRRLPVDV